MTNIRLELDNDIVEKILANNGEVTAIITEALIDRTAKKIIKQKLGLTE